MQSSDVSGMKHLRELIKFATEKMGASLVTIERLGTSGKLRGVFVHNDTPHQFSVNVTLNAKDQRAFNNCQADIVATINDIKISLGLPIIRGIAQIQKSAKPARPAVKVNKPERATLTLFGKAKASTASEPPQMEESPFAALGRLRAAMHPIPDTHKLMVLGPDGWREESSFTSADGVDRRAMKLLREGKAVSIIYAGG